MRRLATLTVVLISILVLSGLDASAAKKKKPEEATKDDPPAWEVGNPPGDWKSITIDTVESTWSNVRVSPDGATIVFDMLGDIYTVPLAGGEATALTDGIEWNVDPTYSPDGSRIAFTSDRGGANNIWVMNADGSDPQAVSQEKEHLVHNPAWSPDGQYIVAKKDFTSTRSIAAGEIWLFHAGGGGGLQLTERPLGKADQKTMAEPSFSPDGRYVYFSQDTTPGRVWEYGKDSTGQIFAIKRLDRETGEIETFVGGPGGAIRPTPSPDGRYLAFVRRVPDRLASALYIKDLQSGREWPIYDSLDRDLQETFGSQGNTSAFGWTPDSRSIVFWAGGKIHSIELETREVRPIPFHVRVQKKIRPALRVPVEVAPEEFDVRMIRWAQMSPDGASVVYQALGRIWVRNAAGGEARRLTAQQDHFEFYPTFSRDGRFIAYVTWDDAELGSVRVVPAAGGAGRSVTSQPGLYVEPRFAPDGESIVYRKLTGGDLLSGEWSMNPGIHLVPTAGGESRLLRRGGSNPQFGAASDRVYFTAGEDSKLLLKSVDLSGHDERTHLAGDKVTEFSLAPDARFVAFTRQYNAYVAPFTATGKTVEVGPEMKSIPVKQVSKRAGEWLHWSADARRLHWSHGATLYTRELKDAFGFIDGSPKELPEPVASGLDLSFRARADVPAGSIALVGGRVVTMRDARTRQEVFENGTVVVRGNRIAAVGPAAEVAIPTDARRIDVSGKTVLPGFLDVHAHGGMATAEITPQQNWMQYSNLAFGVTTIHDPSNDTSSIFSASELQRAGQIVAPRIYSTGSILYGAHVPGLTAEIDGLDDARFHVQRLKDVGAISVKSYQLPRREQRQQLIAAGHELGIMVVPEGGGKFQNNMNMLVDGHTGIEHSLSVAPCYDDVLQLWSQTAVGYTPTLGVSFGGLEGERYWYQHTDVWKNERLMRYTPRFEVEPRAIRRTMAPDGAYNHIANARFAKRLIDAGVSVQVGAHGQREGLASHWEMWMFEQGGFSPFEALRAATADGARYLGLDRDIGSIEAGKLADLVVIDGNPLQDLRRSEYVTYTMLNGRLYDVATMNQVAPDRVERKPFFFELEGGDTIHPQTQSRLRATQEPFSCVH